MLPEPSQLVSLDRDEFATAFAWARDYQFPLRDFIDKVRQIEGGEV